MCVCKLPITFTDDSSISVNAHFEDGILSSSIQFPHDTYVVEVRVTRHKRWSVEVDDHEFYKKSKCFTK